MVTSGLFDSLPMLRASKILSYQSNTKNDNLIITFHGETGAASTSTPLVNVEFATLQQYIENNRALYFGGTSNSGIGVTKFTGLEDTPTVLEPNKLLSTGTTGDGIIMVDQVTSIDNLDDVQTAGSGHDPADGRCIGME